MEHGMTGNGTGGMDAEQIRALLRDVANATTTETSIIVVGGSALAMTGSGQPSGAEQPSIQ
jgi:hypothetical protein